MFSDLTMTVLQDQEAGGSDYNISISCNESMTMESYVYSYGEQPPVLSNSRMELVNDTFEPSRGPAWFRMISFDKVVILPETVLTATATPTPSVAARMMVRGGQGGQGGGQGGNGSGGGSGSGGGASSASNGGGGGGGGNGGFDPFGGGPGDFKRKGVAQSGDKPWICTWPDTFLEIFIYPDQNSSFYRPPTNSSASGTTLNMTMTSGFFSTTATPTSGSPADSSSTSGTPTSYEPSGTLAPIDTGPLISPPPPYPKVVKIEERRVYGAPSPVCSQVVVQGDGVEATPALDADGNPIVVTIIENEPLETSAPSKRYYHDGGSYLYGRDVEEMSDCGCMWWIT